MRNSSLINSPKVRIFLLPLICFRLLLVDGMISKCIGQDYVPMNAYMGKVSVFVLPFQWTNGLSSEHYFQFSYIQCFRGISCGTWEELCFRGRTENGQHHID